MGRLVKSPANQARAERRQFDEEQFLRDAGALASRLQTELQQSSEQGGTETPARRASLPTELAATLNDVAARDLVEPGSTFGPSDEDLGITVEVIDGGEPRLRVFAPKIEDETHDAGVDAAAESGSSATLPRSEVRGIRDQIEWEREELERAKRDLADEQRRWADRHAQQTRQLEQQLEQIDDWKLRLAEREQEMAASERTQAEKLQADWRNRHATEQAETQQLLDQCSLERAELAGEIERLRQEMDRRSREHARIETELRAQLENADDERTTRRLQVVEECDRRMAELTEEKQSLAELRRRTEDEVAASRAAIRQEQRDWERKLADHRQELRDQTQTQERRLAQERAEFQSFVAEETEAINAARRELTADEQEHAAVVSADRRQLDEERAALRASVERLQSVLGQRRQEHEEQLRIEREQLEEEFDRARADLRQELEDIRREELRLLADERSEAESLLEAAREQIERERLAWHSERGEEAAVLKQALQQLEADRISLEKEVAELETHRESVQASFGQQREAIERQIAAEREDHARMVARSEREFADRQQILEQRIAQQEIELQARRERLEHEIRSMHELHERRLAEDRREFEDQCDRRREELAAELDEYRALRDELDNERRDFEREVSRVHSQLEHERSVLRNGLEQMDTQLRMLATSLGEAAPKSAATDAQPTRRPAAQRLSTRHTPPEHADRVEFLDHLQQPSVAHASVPPKRVSAESALMADEPFAVDELVFEAQAEAQSAAGEVSPTEWLGLTGPEGVAGPAADIALAGIDTSAVDDPSGADESQVEAAGGDGDREAAMNAMLDQSAIEDEARYNEPVNTSEPLAEVDELAGAAVAEDELPGDDESAGLAGEEASVELALDSNELSESEGEPLQMTAEESSHDLAAVAEQEAEKVADHGVEAVTDHDAETLADDDVEAEIETDEVSGEAPVVAPGGVALRVDAAEASPRRQLLDRYRSQLGDLQAQLAELSSLRSPMSGDMAGDEESVD